MLTWLNPYRWMLLAGLAAALAVGVPLIVGRYNDGLREEGRAEVREEMRAAVSAQQERNREMQRVAETRYVVQAATRDRFITKTVTELHYVTAPLADCRVPADAIRLLNDAARCARDDSAAACGADDAVPDAR